jgi:stage V sporulation protein B
MSERNLFIRGAFILALAGMISKVLGSVYTIFLQNIIGDHGLGLYQMAYPIYSTLLLLSTAGFPIAVSKFVAEHIAIGDYRGAKNVFRVSAILLMVTGIVFFVLLFFGAPLFASFFGDEASAYAIRAIAPALLVVPVMSAIRGYFQGWQEMNPTAVSQVVEQIVRVATILVAATLLLPYGSEYAAAGAAFGAVTGAIASFLVLLWFIWKRREFFRHDARMQNRVKPKSTWEIVKQLCWYALPVSLGAMVVPLMNNVDVLTVVNLLKDNGYTQNEATEMFGLLSGRAFKLMMLPSTFATAIGAAVMPAISAGLALGNRRIVYNRIELAMRMTMLIALPASVGLALLAKPIDIMLFKDAEGARAITVISVATLVSSLQVTTSAILQGMGIVYLPVRNLLIGGSFKLFLNLALVPLWGIEGAAMSTVISYFVATLLNLWEVYRRTGVVLDMKLLLWRPMLSTFFMAVAAFSVVRQCLPYFMNVMPVERMAYVGTVLLAITAAGVVYGFSLLVTGSLTKEDIRSIPRIGPTIVRVFQWLKLI